jgi:hypothetical protein
MVVSALKAHPLTGLVPCPPVGQTCVGETANGFSQIQVQVVSASASGLGPAKVIDGVRRYQEFNVRACTVNYLAGGAKLRAHVFYLTGSQPTPASVTADDAAIAAFKNQVALGGPIPPDVMAAFRTAQADLVRGQGTPPLAADWQVRIDVPYLQPGC